MLTDRPRSRLPVAQTVELRYRDNARSMFRVPEWAHAPEIIEWNGRRFVKQSGRRYVEASTFSLYAGYNAEVILEETIPSLIRA